MATNTLRVSGDRAKDSQELAVADLSAALEGADGLAWLDMRNPDADERKWLLSQGYHEMALTSTGILGYFVYKGWLSR